MHIYHANTFCIQLTHYLTHSYDIYNRFTQYHTQLWPHLTRVWHISLTIHIVNMSYPIHLWPHLTRIWHFHMTYYMHIQLCAHIWHIWHVALLLRAFNYAHDTFGHFHMTYIIHLDTITLNLDTYVDTFDISLLSQFTFWHIWHIWHLTHSTLNIWHFTYELNTCYNWMHICCTHVDTFDTLFDTFIWHI